MKILNRAIIIASALALAPLYADIESAGKVFETNDFFGKQLDFSDWENAVNDLTRTSKNPATQKISRLNAALIKNIQEAHGAINSNQPDAKINKWKAAFESIELDIFSGIKPVNDEKTAATIIKNAAISAKKQIEANRQKYWKVTSPGRARTPSGVSANPPKPVAQASATRSRAQAGANPPRPIPQAMNRKPLPVPPTAAKGFAVKSK